MTQSYLTITLVSLMLSLRVCVAADSPATEAWYVCVDKHIHHGSEHVVIGRSPAAMWNIELRPAS